jgi:hypothetical protein
MLPADLVGGVLWGITEILTSQAKSEEIADSMTDSSVGPLVTLNHTIDYHIQIFQILCAKQIDRLFYPSMRRKMSLRLVASLVKWHPRTGHLEPVCGSRPHESIQAELRRKRFPSYPA